MGLLAVGVALMLLAARFRSRAFVITGAIGLVLIPLGLIVSTAGSFVPRIAGAYVGDKPHGRGGGYDMIIRGDRDDVNDGTIGFTTETPECSIGQQVTKPAWSFEYTCDGRLIPQPTTVGGVFAAVFFSTLFAATLAACIFVIRNTKST